MIGYKATILLKNKRTPTDFDLLSAKTPKTVFKMITNDVNTYTWLHTHTHTGMNCRVRA